MKRTSIVKPACIWQQLIIQPPSSVCCWKMALILTLWTKKEIMVWSMSIIYCQCFCKWGNKNVQLVAQHCCKISCKAILRVYHPRSNLSCNKSGCWKLRKVVAESESGSTFDNKICTCFAFFRSLPNLFCSKWRNPTSFNPIRSQYSPNLQQRLFTWKQVWTWVIKRATLLFNTFCMNVAKQVALFCCPFYCTLKSAAHSVMVSLVFGTSTSRYSTLCFPLPFPSPSPSLSLKLCISIDFNLSIGRQFIRERRNVNILSQIFFYSQIFYKSF